MPSRIVYGVMVLGLLLLVGLGLQGGAAAAVSAETMGPRFYMRVAVSMVVLLPALYVLVFRTGDKKWAAGIVGTIVGYWLPG